MRDSFSNITADLWEYILKAIYPYIVNYDKCFSKDGKLNFKPPKFGNYSQEEVNRIVTHILKVERMLQKIEILGQERIEDSLKEKLSDCELLTLAEYYIDNNLEEKAMELFARVAESEEIDDNIDYFEVFEELINHWRNRDIDKAIYFMHQRMRKIPCGEDSCDPDMDERDLADLYMTKGEKEKAKEMFKELIRRNPDNIWNYNCAAISLIDGGEYQLAEKYIKEAIELAKRTGDKEDLLPQLKEMLKETMQKQKDDAEKS